MPSSELDLKTSNITKGGGSAAPTSRYPQWWPRSLRGDHLVAILVLAPSVLAVAIFVYGFILWTFRVSFVKWDNWTPDYTFVGLQNWIKLLVQDERFHIDLR